MRKNPFSIVREFEEAIAEYTGAPYAVAVDSCTNAIFLCCLHEKLEIESRGESSYIEISVPKKTYLSVPQSVMHAGFKVKFHDREWTGSYILTPMPVWDCAKWFTSGMYVKGQLMCLSFHTKKRIPIGKGGAILCDSLDSAEWFKKMRYEGRSERPYKEDNIELLGYNMYMTPEQAARGLALLQNYPDYMEEQKEEGGYRDLTTMPLFKGM
jgi:dTDP-4-amino-4,6-dideoxygalactose transaminase